MSVPGKGPDVVTTLASTPLADMRLAQIETAGRQCVAILQEISAKLDVLIAHSDEQVSVNRAMAHFSQMLTGTASVDEGSVRPGFEDYREGSDGWEVLLQYPNQVANWYPANAQEVQQISELNAKRATRKQR